MTYSEPLLNQIYRFFLGCGFGMICCVFYEVLSFLRIMITKKMRAKIILDAVFSFAFAVASLFFMIVYNQGVIRFNLIFAQVIGFLVLHFTAGDLVASFFKRLIPKKIKDKKERGS